MFGFGKSKNDPPAAGEGTGNFASASEQDRYGSHFSGLGDKAADKIKEGANKALHYKGEGAEQDRYGAHFARLGLDEQQVHRAAQAIKNSGKQPGWFSGNFGLGYDGQVRALRMANAQGVGAEQVRS
jgi:hypothetical protein